MLQVRNYYYKLKAQFQKHNPDRDLDDLTQKEMFQAMNRMWSAVSLQASPCLLCCSSPDPAIAAPLCTYPLPTAHLPCVAKDTAVVTYPILVVVTTRNQL